MFSFAALPEDVRPCTPSAGARRARGREGSRRGSRQLLRAAVCAQGRRVLWPDSVSRERERATRAPGPATRLLPWQRRDAWKEAAGRMLKMYWITSPIAREPRRLGTTVLPTRVQRYVENVDCRYPYARRLAVCLRQWRARGGYMRVVSFAFRS